MKLKLIVSMLALFGLASPVQADVLDHCFEGALGGAAFRDANLLADMVDSMASRFSGVPAVDADVAGWRALEVAGLKPAARVWGAGMHPERGIAVCGAPSRMRFVVGADSVKSLQGALKRLAMAMNASFTPSADGFNFDGDSMKCAARDGFVICDTESPAGGETPVWAAGAGIKTDGMIFAGLKIDKPPVRGGYLSVTRRASGVKLTGRLELDRQVAAMAAGMVGDGSPGALGRYIDRSSPALMKLSVNGQQLLGLALAGAPREIKGFLRAIGQTWTGDLALTLDGGFTHPVVLISTKDKASAQRAIKDLVKVLKAEGVPVSVVKLAGRKGMSALEIRVESVAVRVPFAILDAAIVFAASPEDVQRRVDGRVDPMPLEALNRKGTSGVVLSNPGALFDLPWLRETLDLPMFGPSPLISLVSAYVEAFELRFGLKDATVSVDGEVRYLAENTPGYGAYTKAIKAHLKGDGVGAEAQFIQLAAQHAGTPVGWQARGRLTSSAAIVPVAGILAAVAIPAFMKYTRRAKSASARIHLAQMYNGVHMAFMQDGRLPKSAPLTPKKPVCEGGEADFSHPSWKALSFDPGHSDYQYEYVSDGKVFTARAIGDLDCDGILSTFERVGSVQGGVIESGAGIFQLRPDE